MGAHKSVVGADQGFRARSGDQESVRVYGDGGREAAGIKRSVADNHLRAAAILTGRSYTDIKSLFGQRLAQAGHPGIGDWDHAVSQGASRKRPPRVKVVWERDVMEHDLGLTPHKVSGAGPLPTYGAVWARFGDCIVATVRHYTALIDAMERAVRRTATCACGCPQFGRGRRPGVPRSILGPAIGTRFGTRGLSIGPHRAR